MKIAVIGGTGFVGSATVAEAASRGHEVTSATRSGSHAQGATTDVTLALTDTDAVVDLVSSQDATVVAVPAGRVEGDVEPTLAAHRTLIAALSERAPQARLVVVGGAGSLTTPDGTRLVDTADFPEEYATEARTFATVLDLYRAAGDSLAWTLVSPLTSFGDRPTSLGIACRC